MVTRNVHPSVARVPDESAYAVMMMQLLLVLLLLLLLVVLQ